MGLISFIGRIYIVVVNLVLLLVGLAMFAGGMVLRFNHSFTGGIVQQAEDALKKTLSDTGIGKADDIALDVNQLLMSASISLILVGIVISAITFFGCFGACCKAHKLLTIYAIICVVFFVIEVVGIALLYASNVLSDPMKEQLKNSINNDYLGLGGSNFLSVAWNIAMIKGECCGVDGHEDFANAAKWNNTLTFGDELTVPVACCKTLPESINDLNCAQNPTDETSNWKTGCYEQYWNWTIGNKSFVIGPLAAVGLFQILLIGAAIVIIKSEDNNSSNKTAPQRTTTTTRHVTNSYF